MPGEIVPKKYSGIAIKSPVPAKPWWFSVELETMVVMDLLSLIHI